MNKMSQLQNVTSPICSPLCPMYTTLQACAHTSTILTSDHLISMCKQSTESMAVEGRQSVIIRVAKATPVR